MREQFHEQLDAIFDDLAGICRMVEVAVGDATESLMNGDVGIAERVISADLDIDLAREKVEESAFNLLSLQQPVAGDLRTVVAALRMVSELERMGDLSVHVAEIIVSRDVEAAITLRNDDEEMDQLRRASFTELLADGWSHGVEAAVDIALLGRYYERIADHAVSVANRVVFVVTGQNPTSVIG